ncbi:MAG: DUF5719 family protein [Propionibacteriaceae bacterium]|nr:DUF5719 family protein [Propionibacteriaceae bacterium]
MKIKDWATLAVAVVAVATVATAVLAPERSAAQPVIQVEGQRLVACPVGDPAFGPTTVSAAGQTELTSWQVGSEATASTIAFEVKDPGEPVVAVGDQSLGAVVTSVQHSKLQAVVCAPPISNGWWNGVWVTESQRSSLILTNIDSTAAIITISLHGESGPLTTTGLRDIEIPRFSTRVVPLNTYLTSEEPVAVALKTSQGRLMATLRSQGDLGTDWQQSAAAPAIDSVIPWSPAGEGNRLLFLTNPSSERRAEVQVEALGPEQSYIVAGAENVSIAPGATARVELGQALRGQGVGLRVTSTQPVSATLVATGPDLAGLSAQPPLGGGIVLPVVPGATLALTNPTDEEITLTLVRRDAEGAETAVEDIVAPPGSREVPVGASDGSIKLTASGLGLRVALVLTQIGQTEGLALAPLGVGGAAGLSLAIAYRPTIG